MLRRLTTGTGTGGHGMTTFHVTTGLTGTGRGTPTSTGRAISVARESAGTQWCSLAFSGHGPPIGPGSGVSIPALIVSGSRRRDVVAPALRADAGRCQRAVLLHRNCRRLRARQIAPGTRRGDEVDPALGPSAGRRCGTIPLPLDWAGRGLCACVGAPSRADQQGESCGNRSDQANPPARTTSGDI
jgi:hypothetical protein